MSQIKPLGPLKIMGNKESREHMKESDLSAQIVRAQTEERSVLDDVLIMGIGHRRLQLVCMPSFTVGYSWDVRQLGNVWRLFRGEIPPAVCRVRGYTELKADSTRLRSFFDEVCSLTLPLTPTLNNMAGCDGTSFQLAAFGDMDTAFRFEWWCECPKQWSPLGEVAERMMEYFESLPSIET